MTTRSRYTLPMDSISWGITLSQETVFRWEYDDGRDALLALYDKGKRQQWDANTRIDWAQDLDADNPMLLPDETISLYGSDIWNKLNAAELANLRRHMQSWQISQFLHGEQGALICAAKIVQQVEQIDAKFYAATQVIDEARHVEAYSRLLHEKFDMVYPINKQLQALLDDVITSKDWDFTYLGMQVVIEGLALAAFQGIRDKAQNPLAAQVNAYVMQDEARHVAFGRLALRDYYPQLTEAERDRREEFLVEACYLMRDRMTPADVWEATGLDVKACWAFHNESEPMRKFRSRLFSRIVPTVRDIGLWGPRVRKAYTDMGVMQFAEVDAAAILEEDNRIAEDFDARRMVNEALSVAPG
ncbi:MAG TPA: ferritin-like domain-containing protein [Stellaceae bacterium]|nr:ferritin-like domain-containing protein [Stellaceae bacterium]